MLPQGARVGSYEILGPLGPLGAGGKPGYLPDGSPGQHPLRRVARPAAFLLIKPETTTAQSTDVRVIVNWADELARKAPLLK